MPTYFDPITLSQLEIDEDTILYLVEVTTDIRNPQLNTYSIKGISSGLDQLPNDPHTHAAKYWPINTATFLLTNSTEERRALFFPGGQLTSNPLSTSDVMLYLGFNPNAINPTLFNPQIAQQLQEDWISDIHQGWVQAQIAQAQNSTGTILHQLTTSFGINVQRHAYLNTLVESAHISPQELIGLNTALLQELAEHHEIVNRLVNSNVVSFHLLIGLSGEIRHELYTHNCELYELVKNGNIPIATLIAQTEAVRSNLYSNHSKISSFKNIPNLTTEQIISFTQEEMDKIRNLLPFLTKRRTVTIEQTNLLSVDEAEKLSRIFQFLIIGLLTIDDACSLFHNPIAKQALSLDPAELHSTRQRVFNYGEYPEKLPLNQIEQLLEIPNTQFIEYLDSFESTSQNTLSR